MSFSADQFLTDLLDWKLPKEEEIFQLFNEAIELFLQEPNVLSLSSPISVCGDVHGQFFDVLRLFQVGGSLPNTKYLFLGDYVDRGRFSLKTLCLLLCLKVKYPQSLYLIRGNHESRQVTRQYGFYEDCLSLYGSSAIWNHAMDVFDTLPVAALIDSSIFCVHGGLSPQIRTVDQINLINRLGEASQSTPFGDLLWSDPEEQYYSSSSSSSSSNSSSDKLDISPKTYANGFKPSSRGAGYVFNADAAKIFCSINNLSLIARAHQLAEDGYKYMDGSDKKVVTVWSAPNYMYTSGNRAAIMQVLPDLSQHFLLFSEVPECEREVPKERTVRYFL